MTFSFPIFVRPRPVRFAAGDSVVESSAPYTAIRSTGKQSPATSGAFHKGESVNAGERQARIDWRPGRTVVARSVHTAAICPREKLSVPFRDGPHDQSAHIQICQTDVHGGPAFAVVPREEHTAAGSTGKHVRAAHGQSRNRQRRQTLIDRLPTSAAVGRKKHTLVVGSGEETSAPVPIIADGKRADVDAR